jgi:hypothetical protein
MLRLFKTLAGAACGLLLLGGCRPTPSQNLAPANARAEREIYAGRYKALFTAPPQKVPTAKTPDGPLAGNGDIGLTLGGSPDKLSLYLGKNDFWRAYPVYPGGGIALPGGLDLAIADLVGATYYAEQIPDKAAIRGRFEKGGLQVNLHAWVTATHNTMVAELTANKACRVKLNLWAPQGNTSVNQEGQTGEVYWVSRSFENTPLLAWPSHVALAMKVLGARPAADRTVQVAPGKKVTLTVTLYTNHDRPDWKEGALGEARALTTAGIENWRREHENWWQQFWGRSQVQIGDPGLEKYYYTSQYLFACSSRENKFAPGIWGPFITKDSTAWGGDYHLNYNYQAPYWAAYSSNYISLTDNFDQPVLDYMEQGKAHARSLLQVRGIYYPVGIGPKGLVTTRWPLAPEEMERRYASRENTIDGGYKFLGQKINAVFSAGNMLMRFYSTYDEAYARRVYPYLLACGDFWEDYLKFEKGRYVIYQDHFNEVYPNHRNKGQWRQHLGDFNSTLSLGLVKMLFKGLLEMSAFLDTDAARREKWQHIVTHLSSFPLGEVNGRLSLKNMERGPQNSEVPARGLNRVAIHGLLLPGGVVGPKTDPELNKILLSDVDHWEDKVQNPGEWGNTLGNGIETTFPGAVRVGYNSDYILQQLRDRLQVKAQPNGWVTQEGGGIETLAAVPLTINEMLLQSYEGVLRIFPNWNHRRDARFETLRAYGAFLVSSSLQNGRVAYLRLQSEKGRPCTLDNPWPGKTVQLTRNGQAAETLTGATLRFLTSAGETLELRAL